MKTKKTASQRGKASRNKGKELERRIANMLKDRGIEARRGVQFDGQFVHDIVTDLPFNFEAKAVESLNIHNAMEQSRHDSKIHQTIPTVVHKRNNKPILLTMDFQDFIDLLQYAIGYVDEKNTLDLREVRQKYISEAKLELDADCL